MEYLSPLTALADSLYLSKQSRDPAHLELPPLRAPDRPASCRSQYPLQQSRGVALRRRASPPAPSESGPADIHTPDERERLDRLVRRSYSSFSWEREMFLPHHYALFDSFGLMSAPAAFHCALH